MDKMQQLSFLPTLSALEKQYERKTKSASKERK